MLNEYDDMVLAGVKPDTLIMNCVVEAKAQNEGTQQARETLQVNMRIAATAEQWWFQPTQERPAVDTTGCGDAFAAGFLFGWSGAADVRRGLVYGCACGAAAVGQVGGSSPLAVENVNLCMRRNEGIYRDLPDAGSDEEKAAAAWQTNSYFRESPFAPAEERS